MKREEAIKSILNQVIPEKEKCRGTFEIFEMINGERVTKSKEYFGEFEGEPLNIEIEIVRNKPNQDIV